MKNILFLASTLVLSGCITAMQDLPTLKFPKLWDGQSDNVEMIVETAPLKSWWNNFNDPVLTTLVQRALADSPDRNIAKARIMEARGLRRTARSFLFPTLGASADVKREDFGNIGPDNFYETGFDVSYEVDVFGRIRNTVNAQEQALLALEAEYHDISLTLVADVARSYINYRAAQKQAAIAHKNLKIQTKTLALIKQQYEFGEAPKLDVERSENLVNTTKASIPEFQRLADNYRLQLSVLTGDLPEDLYPIISPLANIPNTSIKPVLLAPANVLSVRPDIQAAAANLSANTALTKTAVAELFPVFTLEGFFGYGEIPAISSTEAIWRIVLGSAVNLIDFGRVEGAIDAARAREKQAYELMRKTVLEAVTEVETSLSDASHINEQRVSLQKAFENAERSFVLSEALYKEGEISFLDVLDAQRTVNEADSALVNAEASQAESLVRLYKSLGVY